MSNNELAEGYRGGDKARVGSSAQDAADLVFNTPGNVRGSRQNTQERRPRRGSNTERSERRMSGGSAAAAAVDARDELDATRDAHAEHAMRQLKEAIDADGSQQLAESPGVATIIGRDGRRKGKAPAAGHQFSRQPTPTDDGPPLRRRPQQGVEERQYESGTQLQFHHPQHYSQQQDQHQGRYEQQPQQWHQQQSQRSEQLQQYQPHYHQRLSTEQPTIRRWPSSEWKYSQSIQGSRPQDCPTTPAVPPPPFVHILQRQHQQKPTPAHTTEAEIHFIGELEAGQGFCCSGGLFCEFSFEAGDHWLSLCRAGERIHQTQTAYGSVGDLYVWNHPIDLHYALSSVVGWPRCRLSIWKLNSFGKVENVSYGTITLPTTAGHHEFTCQTWTPLGTYSEEFAGRFLGRRTELDSLDVLDSKIGDRMKLTTRSSGQVLFVLDVIQRNFEYHGLTSCSQYPAANIGSNVCLAFTNPQPLVPFQRKNTGTERRSENEQQQKPEYRTLGTSSSYSKLSESGHVLDAPGDTAQLFGEPKRGLSAAMCPVSPRGKLSSNKKKV